MITSLKQIVLALDRKLLLCDTKNGFTFEYNQLYHPLTSEVLIFVAFYGRIRYLQYTTDYQLWRIRTTQI